MDGGHRDAGFCFRGSPLLSEVAGLCVEQLKLTDNTEPPGKWCRGLFPNTWAPLGALDPTPPPSPLSRARLEDLLCPLNIPTREPVGASALAATCHPCHGGGYTAARDWAIVPAQGRVVRILASLSHVVSSQPPAPLLWPENSWADDMQVSMCGSAPARLLSTEQVLGGLGPRSCRCRGEGAAPPACGGRAVCAGSRPGGLGLPVPGNNWPRCPAQELLAPPGASQAAGVGGATCVT